MPLRNVSTGRVAGPAPSSVRSWRNEPMPDRGVGDVADRDRLEVVLVVADAGAITDQVVDVDGGGTGY